MKATILAAGLGSRLKTLTANKPKALVEVSGKPIIQYQISNLIRAGINEIIIVIGYMGERIRDYVSKTFPDIQTTYFENAEYQCSNSSYSFWQARMSLIGDNYLHLNCDILFSFDLLIKVINSNYPNVIAVRRDLKLSNNMENVVLEGDRIIDMSLINTPQAMGKAFGLAKLSDESTNYIIKKLEKYIDEGDKNQNYYGMIRQAVKELDYRAMITDKYHLLEINSLSDHETATKIVSEGNFKC